ncbi:hypothetical protein IFM89_021457 [Coptis chinensis]|uniref:RNA-binding protein 48 n=1 Tax=Coptis chinensis TaxID=261450 RepID=A0A835ITP4_9MAGN|nr:hypothetical protein IFM89_021457 [Coptis chinensis]
MPRNETPAVRVYTVCDESKYLIVKNVPALGCGDEVLKLLESYGEIEECKPMDEEECEPFTDVYWIKFLQVSNARFAKRKLDEFVFLGNKLHVSYAPNFETLIDTKEKLECRRREVLARLNKPSLAEINNNKREGEDLLITRVSSNDDYFTSSSMNNTVNFVRGKLHKIQSSGRQESEHGIKKARVDNRRRI